MNFFTQIEFFTIFPLNFHHVHFHTTTIPSVNRNLKVHSTHFVRKLDHPLFAKNQLNKRNIVPNDRLNRKGHGIVWSNGNRISRSTGSPANRMFRVPSSAGLISKWHHVLWPVTPISHASRNNNRRLNTHHANIYSFGTRSREVQFDRADLISDSFQLYESYLCMCIVHVWA